MNKILVVDYEKCTGCRNCEMACSVFHVQACNPTKSAVRIVKLSRSSPRLGGGSDAPGTGLGAKENSYSIKLSRSSPRLGGGSDAPGPCPEPATSSVESAQPEGTGLGAKENSHSIKWEREGLNVPIVCQQCEEAACANICPVQAIARDTDTGALIVDYDLCLGCRMCIVACPFGAVTLDKDRRQAIKCDLCGGVEPWCIRFCEPGALTYKLPAAVSLHKKRVAGRRLVEALSVRPAGGTSS